MKLVAKTGLTMNKLPSTYTLYVHVILFAARLVMEGAVGLLCVVVILSVCYGVYVYLCVRRPSVRLSVCLYVCSVLLCRNG